MSSDTVAALSQDAQILSTIGGTSGYCQFVQATLNELRQFVEALFDRAVGGRELVETGWQCLQSEWEFN